MGRFGNSSRNPTIIDYERVIRPVTRYKLEYLAKLPQRSPAPGLDRSR